MLSAKMTLPRLSTMFTGRQDILKQLEHCLDPKISSITLKKQRIFVLYGLGGGGKTQIMAKFVNDFGDECDAPSLLTKKFADPSDLCLGFLASTSLTPALLKPPKPALKISLEIFPQEILL